MNPEEKEIILMMLSEVWSWDNNRHCERFTMRALLQLGFTEKEIRSELYNPETRIISASKKAFDEEMKYYVGAFGGGKK